MRGRASKDVGLVRVVHELRNRSCDRVDGSKNSSAMGLLDAIHKSLREFLYNKNVSILKT